MSINISDYNRSGVFIEERDNSTIDRPVAQEGTVNFVPGFSRTSTVFNRPVLVRSDRDRDRYFGKIDRFLEKKGSFFHRTLDVATQTAPVWALNLLKTNSLDTLDYVSLSTSAQTDNDVIKTKQYDDFFNKSGFWLRDVESFLFFAQDNDRIMHITNMGNRKVTIFTYKSDNDDFDVTAEKWYEGKDKVPTWMDPKDLISDYMVRVVILRGDWSHYTQLSIDPNYQQYFNTNGLRKEEVDGFLNKREVTVLGDYTGSLIPYFRDNNKNLLFIETLINLETDTTGVFCSFDIEAVETDFPTGNIDIIGHSLVGKTKKDINYLSYQEHIEETDKFDQTELDRLGNSFGIGSVLGNIKTMTSVFTNENMDDLKINTSIGTFATDTTPTIGVTDGGAGYVIINNMQVPVSTQAKTLHPLTAPTTDSTYNITVVYLDETGTLNVIEGPGLEFAAGTTAEGSVTGLIYPSNYPKNAVVLGHIFRELKNDNTTYINTYVPLSLDGAFIPLVMDGTTTTSGEIIVDNTTSNVLALEFLGTASAPQAQYKEFRLLKFYDEIISQISFGRSIIIAKKTLAPNIGDYVKVQINQNDWTDNSSNPVGNRKLEITVDPIYDIQTEAITLNNLIIYYIDDEFVVDNGTDVFGLETRINETSTSTINYGIVSKFSKLYDEFYSGNINTGDYFYQKLGDANVTFIKYTDTTNPLVVGNYIVFDTSAISGLGISTGDTILLDEHSVNSDEYNLGDSEDGNASGSILHGDGLISTTETAFKIPESIKTAPVENTAIYDFDLKTYIKFFTVTDDLQVRFYADNTLQSPMKIDAGLLSTNGNLKIYSNVENYEQTLEIEEHVNFDRTDTSFLIDMNRYPEVIVGDYVKAAMPDPSDLEPGEYFNQFARILKKLPWSENATESVEYAVVSVDKKVAIETYSGDLQTTRYTSIQKYIDTLKASVLKGFNVQATSMPDGTESRQKEVLDILAKDTAIFKAIGNKNKFNFRYLIDSFGLGLTEFSKQQLMNITGDRKNALSFLNMPSARSFKKSTSPTFINTDGTLNMEFVRKGGDLNKNPTFLYSFGQQSGTIDGRSTTGYFFPYVTVNDNGRPLDFPPASYVCNTYTRKLNSSVSGIYNWTIAAGIEDGIINGIADVEMDLTNDDLVELYKMQANPIVYTKNVGFNIETEWSAQAYPLSSLSYLHAREVLIDLENELYAMLLKYRWKYNTVAIRNKIKREADNICRSFVDKSGLYDFDNVIDETNNTPTLIDNQFGLLETYVEIVKGMGIIVNVINVQKTGDIGSSTGFGGQ